MGKIRSLFGSERGATMVEHAIILPIFLLLIFSVVDLCYFSFNALTLQFGISRAMRAAAIDPGMSAAQMRSSLESALAGLGVKLEPQDHVSLCPVSISNTCGETSIIAGDQNELMVLRIRKKFGSLFVNFIAPFLTLNAEAVGRNEPQ